MATRRPPVQDRSNETLERMVAASSSTVATRGFDGTSIREICDLAGVSTGAFYARFRRTEDLALSLFQSLREEYDGIVETSIGRCRDAGLEAAISTLLEGAIALYRRHAGLLRALTSLACSSRDLARAMREQNEELFSRLLALPHDDEVHHPRPQIALRLGLLSILNTVKEVVLDQHLFREPHPFGDGLLVRELTTLFVRYVIAEPR